MEFIIQDEIKSHRQLYNIYVPWFSCFWWSKSKKYVNFKNSQLLTEEWSHKQIRDYLKFKYEYNRRQSKKAVTGDRGRSVDN